MLQHFSNLRSSASTPPGQIHLVSNPNDVFTRQAQPSSLAELAVIISRRCSSFFAEAAVLVLVFGILDYLIQKGRIEFPWILGAVALSVSLLVASIAMDFSAQRWVKAHP